MREHDPLVLSYSHLAHFPRASEALQTLKKVASLVKPIMRARKWKVGELAEFFPDQANLLGTRFSQVILLVTFHPQTHRRTIQIHNISINVCIYFR